RLAWRRRWSSAEVPRCVPRQQSFGSLRVGSSSAWSIELARSLSALGASHPPFTTGFQPYSADSNPRHAAPENREVGPFLVVRRGKLTLDLRERTDRIPRAVLVVEA